MKGKLIFLFTNVIYCRTVKRPTPSKSVGFFFIIIIICLKKERGFILSILFLETKMGSKIRSALTMEMEVYQKTKWGLMLIVRYQTLYFAKLMVIYDDK